MKKQKPSLRAKRSNPVKAIILILLAAAAITYFFITKNEHLTSSPDSKPTVKIGVIYPMSGDGANFGEAAKDEVKMFFEEFNKTGRNFQYEVLFEDNQLKPAKNAILANKLIQVDKVDWIITCLSNFGAVVSPIAEKNETFHFSIATDPIVAKGYYNFMASSNVKEETQKLYDTLLNNDAKRVDIVLVSATGPESMIKYFKDIVAEKGEISIDNIHSVNVDEKDYRTIIAKIKANNPDYVIVMLQMPGVDIFLKQYKEANINIPFTGIETFTYLEHKELAEGMWYIDAASATNDFEGKYKAYTSRNTTDYSEYMDMMLQIITTAYETTKTKDKLTIAEYVLNNSDGIDTAIGVVKHSGDGILDGAPVLKKVIEGNSVLVTE